MIGINLVRLGWKHVVRHPARTTLTVLGVAAGMFLFTVVQAMQDGLEAATARTAGDTRLTVFRAHRFCPSTSRLPERYGAEIARVEGVASVMPIQVVVNSCGTGLDIVAFRGVPADQLAAQARRLRADPAMLAAWQARSDAALIGSALASRRRLGVGQRFEAAGVTVTVAGIIASDEPQDRNVAFVHLPFLQRSAHGPGWVTQFDVRVADPARLDAVARAIDERFAREAEPTSTAPEQAFFAQAAGDVLDLVGFTRWVGLAAVAAVLALIANTVLLAARARVRDHAVLATLGYRGRHLALVVAAEGLVLGAAGGAFGAGAALVALARGGVSLTSEGLSVVFPSDPAIGLAALAIAALLGLVASALPALQAARRPILDGLRGA